MSFVIAKSVVEDGLGYVHIEGDDMQELLSRDARKMAYDERIKLGLPSAGIDAPDIVALDEDGNEIEEIKSERQPVRWRRIFRLTQSPV